MIRTRARAKDENPMKRFVTYAALDPIAYNAAAEAFAIAKAAKRADERRKEILIFVKTIVCLQARFRGQLCRSALATERSYQTLLNTSASRLQHWWGVKRAWRRVGIFSAHRFQAATTLSAWFKGILQRLWPAILLDGVTEDDTPVLHSSRLELARDSPFMGTLLQREIKGWPEKGKGGSGFSDGDRFRPRFDTKLDYKLPPGTLRPLLLPPQGNLAYLPGMFCYVSLMFPDELDGLTETITELLRCPREPWCDSFELFSCAVILAQFVHLSEIDTINDIVATYGSSSATIQARFNDLVRDEDPTECFPSDLVMRLQVVLSYYSTDPFMETGTLDSTSRFWSDTRPWLDEIVKVVPEKAWAKTVAIAGGSCCDWARGLDPQTPTSDIDLFVCGDDSFETGKTLVKTIAKAFASITAVDYVLVGLSTSVVTIQAVSPPGSTAVFRPVQVVFSFRKSINDLVASFDLDATQVMINPKGRVFQTPLARRAIVRKKAEIAMIPLDMRTSSGVDIKNKKGEATLKTRVGMPSVRRLLKYQAKGFEADALSDASPDELRRAQEYLEGLFHPNMATDPARLRSLFFRLGRFCITWASTDPEPWAELDRLLELRTEADTFFSKVSDPSYGPSASKSSGKCRFRGSAPHADEILVKLYDTASKLKNSSGKRFGNVTLPSGTILCVQNLFQNHSGLAELGQEPPYNKLNLAVSRGSPLDVWLKALGLDSKFRSDNLAEFSRLPVLLQEDPIIGLGEMPCDGLETGQFPQTNEVRLEVCRIQLIWRSGRERPSLSHSASLKEKMKALPIFVRFVVTRALFLPATHAKKRLRLEGLNLSGSGSGSDSGSDSDSD